LTRPARHPGRPSAISYNKGTPAFDTPTFSVTVGSTGGGTVATPTFAPAPGTCTSAQSVTLATPTAGATIRSTTDGITPTAASPAYSGPVAITTTKTLKAIAQKAGMTHPAVASGLYTITFRTRRG
jgi:hypothetical protein